MLCVKVWRCLRLPPRCQNRIASPVSVSGSRSQICRLFFLSVSADEGGQHFSCSLWPLRSPLLADHRVLFPLPFRREQATSCFFFFSVVFCLSSRLEAAASLPRFQALANLVLSSDFDFPRLNLVAKSRRVSSFLFSRPPLFFLIRHPARTPPVSPGCSN